MKSETAVKYPHSANLFQFCRRVLDHKFGGIRVIDQDVGQILGFDPADCSHWKKGKKNIRSIQAMKSIGEHLGIDDKLVIDVASGDITDLEAFFEYAGYGSVSINPKTLDQAKKEYYRKNASGWSQNKELEFKSYFTLDLEKIDQVVRRIHQKINFNEAPLYLPEITMAYPEIELSPQQKSEEAEPTPFPVKSTVQKDQIRITYPSDTKMKPYIRYQIAKAITPFFLDYPQNLPVDLEAHFQHISEVQANVFAAKLLTPAKLIKKELQNLNISKDIISQLAEIFWVSKTFMNRRLKEVLESNSDF